MEILIYSVVAIFCFAIFRSTWAFSKLIEIEYSSFRDQWIADGKPIGGKARKEATFWSNSLPRELFYKWCGTTPDWVKQSKEAQYWHKQMRIWGTIFASSFLSFVIAAIIWLY